MTQIDDVNTCLSTYTGPIEQTNCIATALGYHPVDATSATTTCPDVNQIDVPVIGCKNKYLVIAGGLGIAVLVLLLARR